MSDSFLDAEEILADKANIALLLSGGYILMGGDTQ